VLEGFAAVDVAEGEVVAVALPWPQGACVGRGDEREVEALSEGQCGGVAAHDRRAWVAVGHGVDAQLDPARGAEGEPDAHLVGGCVTHDGAGENKGPACRVRSWGRSS